MSARDLDSAKILQQISKALDILEKEPLLLAQRHILEGYTLTPNMPVIASLSEIFTGEKMTQKEMTDNSDESLEGASYLVYRLKNNAPELLLRVHERRDRVVASLSRLESGKYVAEIHGTDRVPGGDVLDVVFRSAELFQAHFVTDDTTGDILWKNDTLTATLSGSST